MKIVRYWLRMLAMPPYRLPRKCYDMMKSYDSHGEENWVTHIRYLLPSIGFGDVWQKQAVESQSFFISAVTQRLKDIFFSKLINFPLFIK